MKIPISQIKVGERQRSIGSSEEETLGDVQSLADSMARVGQIHSIGLRSNNELVWGRRRLAAATLLGWPDIEATVRDDLTTEMAYEIELEEDVRREQRTWQSEVISVASLYALRAREARLRGESFGYREFAERYPMFGKSLVQEYVNTVAVALLVEPKDTEVWSCENYSTAFQLLRTRVESKTYTELQARNKAAADAIARAKLDDMVWVGGPAGKMVPKSEADKFYAEKEARGEKVERPVQSVDLTPAWQPVNAKRLTLYERSQAYNQQFEHLGFPNTRMYYQEDKVKGREGLFAFWFVGGGNISDFYGSYQTEYIKRISSLFPDVQGKHDVVHLFSGSIPISDDYSVVGLTDANNPPDIVCDAEKLSSGLGFEPFLIYADPPYSVEDSEHYANSMVNRDRVVQECGIVLQQGGYLVWLDQALPLFSGEVFELVGSIGYVRSTGNRFRMITILRKHEKCKNTESIVPTLPTNSIPKEGP